MFQNNSSGIPIPGTLMFPILRITWTKSRFPSSVKRCNFTPDFSNYPIFKSNFRFPWRFQKSEFRCVFGMIIDLFDVKIGNVVFTVIWVPVYNSRFRALCIFFRAMRSPPPNSEGAVHLWVLGSPGSKVEDELLFLALFTNWNGFMICGFFNFPLMQHVVNSFFWKH